MIVTIARAAFSIPMKAPFTRIMKLTTGAAKSRSMMRVFDVLSSKVAKEAETKDIELLEKFTILTKFFEEFSIPFDHPINDVAAKIKALRSIDGTSMNTIDTQSVK